MKPHVVLAVLAAQAAWAAGPESWLSHEFPEVEEVRSAALLKDELFFEVPVSKLAEAEERLASMPAVAQKPYNAVFFGRPDFSCRAPASLFLLRAVYSNGSTGADEIKMLAAGSVWVSHHSLGRSTGQHRSACLACLASTPTRVYVSSSGAM